MDEKLTNTHVQQYISVSFEIYFNVWNIHNILVRVIQLLPQQVDICEA